MQDWTGACAGSTGCSLQRQRTEAKAEENGKDLRDPEEKGIDL
jgi:hypothetical protein